MDRLRIVVVDDSAFSVAFIRRILEDNGFEVVGSAGSLEEVKEVVYRTKPSLVTMDMTIPGTDGLECTRAIHEIDKNIKVIVISSMMDDEIVNEAKKNKVSGYIQKPVDEAELITAINRIVTTNELYEFLQEEYFTVFKEALLDGFNRMTKSLINYKEEYTGNSEHRSKGMTVIMGIIGMFSGRVILDLSKESAVGITAKMLGTESANNDDVIAALGELTNIIAGNACSVLNKKKKELGLRVAPPSVLSGENVFISAQGFTTSTAIADTSFGTVTINIGFQRGDE